MDGIAQLALTLAVGTVASFAVFKLSVLLYERVKSPLLNPLLVTVAFIIAALVALRIPLDSYEQSVQLISFLLGPATVALAGITSITVAAVIVTGILGAITAPLMARLFRVRDGIAKGVAIGTCSHAVGTTKALEMGELEGAMSGVSIAVSGLLTTAIVIVASCFL